MQISFRRSAFTLIEILTVVSIIGILAALLFPVLGKMRESARQTQSLSNLRQIGVAVIGYAQDNEGLLVHAQDVPGSGDRFSNVLQNFVEGNQPGTPQWVPSWGVSGAFRCPAYDNPSQRWKTGFGMHQYLNAYIVSGDFTQTNQPLWYGQLRIINFPRLSHTIIMGSAPDHVINVRRSTGFIPANSSPNRHGNSASYLFLDGHVKSLTPEEALEIFP